VNFLSSVIVNLLYFGRNATGFCLVFGFCFLNEFSRISLVVCKHGVQSSLLRMCCTGNRLAELMFSCAIGTITLSVYLYDLHVVFAMN
jgi:hypothetical protein